MISFLIHGEAPAKKNSRIITRSGRNFPSKRYSDWHKTAFEEVMLLKNRIGNPFPIKDTCRITLLFTHGDLRRRDSDNGTSSVLDLLTDCGVLEDDKWQIVRELRISNDYEKGNPHCRVEIETL